MPLYKWYGITATGKPNSGTLRARTQSSLKNELRHQHIFPLKIMRLSSTLLWHTTFIPTCQITAFIEQLTTLINANIPLVTALELILQEETKKNLKILITACKNSLLAGQSLATTLSQYPRYFNNLLCSLVNVGEQTGTLDTILRDITNHRNNLARQQRQLIRILLYPLIILTIAILVTLLLLIFVVPQFKEIYSNLGTPLPSYTLLLINAGELLQQHWLILLISLTSLIGGSKILSLNSKQFKHYLSNLALKLPLSKTLMTYIIVIRFTKTTGLAFKAGIPLLYALKLAATTNQTRCYQVAMQKVIEAIAHGSSLHQAIATQHLFPLPVSQLLAIGEESGTLELMLEKITTIYTEKLNYSLANLHSLLEPLLILMLGIIIGGIIIGIYLPILRLGMTGG